jgi:hypothetical protein
VVTHDIDRRNEPVNWYIVSVLAIFIQRLRSPVRCAVGGLTITAVRVDASGHQDSVVESGFVVSRENLMKVARWHVTGTAGGRQRSGS